MVPWFEKYVPISSACCTWVSKDYVLYIINNFNGAFDNSHFLTDEFYHYELGIYTFLDNACMPHHPLPNQRFGVIPDPGYVAHMGEVFLPPPAGKAHSHAITAALLHSPILPLRAQSCAANKRIHSCCSARVVICFRAYHLEYIHTPLRWSAKVAFSFFNFSLSVPYHAFLFSLFPLIRVYPRRGRLGYSHVKDQPMRWRGLGGV